MKNEINNGPVDVSSSPFAQWKPLEIKNVLITGGFWQERQEINRRVSLKHGFDMLIKAGNINNLKLAAGMETGEFKGRNFSDETVYKWLEAVAWELNRSGDKELKELADGVILIIQAAQQENGYLDSYYQVVEPDQKFADLDHSHELYCAGFLLQAAVAFERGLGDERLLKVACRLADNLDAVFGPGKREGTCGHPEIEMALVELYRSTHEKRYLNLAEFYIDQRGKGKMRGYAGYGAEYHQDHLPVRSVNELTGHAVRQIYLLTGITDLYMETGEQALLDASIRLWNDLTQTKMFITGGVGSRYDGEAFGSAYELPSDVCYCETCAAIGNLFWNWRLLLITGDSRYADLIERTLYNGILSSPGLDGRHFYYANPLMVRDGRYVRLSSNPPEGQIVNGRPEWHEVACCPPNVMRLFASLGHYFATRNLSGIQIHQYGQTRITSTLANGEPIILKMDSNYPWEGMVRIQIEQSKNTAFSLSLRIPNWQRGMTVYLNGDRIKEPVIKKGYLVLDREWKSGDVIDLDLPMNAFLVEPNPRIDATRGCQAIQRGPIVYCLEAHDQAAEINLLDVQMDPRTTLPSVWREELGGIMTVETNGYELLPETWLQDLYKQTDQLSDPKTRKIHLISIPYFAWGNRGLRSMRVWIPKSTGTQD
jgi:DUF1680 family protein